MSSMADPVVMLFLGGFVLAIMAERYGLDVTLARALLKLFGTKPEVVLLGFLLMIAVFSMFMSNTATAAMMLALLTPVPPSFRPMTRARWASPSPFRSPRTSAVSAPRSAPRRTPPRKAPWSRPASISPSANGACT